MGFMVKNRALKSGDSGVVLPIGPNATRPLHPVAGQLRYNTEFCRLEYFTGVAFLPVATYAPSDIDSFTFVGDGVSFEFGPIGATSTHSPNLLVFVGQLYQNAGTYTVDETGFVTLTEAPAAGVSVSILKIAGRSSESACVI